MYLKKKLVPTFSPISRDARDLYTNTWHRKNRKFHNLQQTNRIQTERQSASTIFRKSKKKEEEKKTIINTNPRVLVDLLWVHRLVRTITYKMNTTLGFAEHCILVHVGSVAASSLPQLCRLCWFEHIWGWCVAPLRLPSVEMLAIVAPINFSPFAFILTHLHTQQFVDLFGRGRYNIALLLTKFTYHIHWSIVKAIRQRK